LKPVGAIKPFGGGEGPCPKEATLCVGGDLNGYVEISRFHMDIRKIQTQLLLISSKVIEYEPLPLVHLPDTSRKSKWT
jgi:hypothetical protein